MNDLTERPQGSVPVDLLVTNIGELCPVHAAGETDGPQCGADLGNLGAVSDGALAVGGGCVVATGSRAELVARLWGEEGPGAAVEIVDAGGHCVVPGYVDPHTHTVFGRLRQDEYERRLRGETYLEIAAAGGGIQSSVQDLRQRSEDELVALAVPRLRERQAVHGLGEALEEGHPRRIRADLLDCSQKAAGDLAE